MTTETSFNLSTYLVQRRAVVNGELETLFQPGRKAPRIMAAMRYALMAGGKRLRPILCIAAAEAVGGTHQPVLSAACALEIIHTYSLIHDDLPGMDDDDLRRGKPTCHLAFDEATAILAGDALLTLAFEILASSFGESQSTLALKTIKTIAQAIGHGGLIEGQMRDIQSEGSRLSTDALKILYELKTGALIRASIETGAVLSGADTHQVTRLRTYAGHIGLAFQVADDILNVEGDPNQMGKAVGTDAVRNKNTYPSLLGLESAKNLTTDLVHQALVSLEPFDDRSDPLRAIARYIVDRNR